MNGKTWGGSRILLVEPDSLIRRTVVGVVRTLGFVDIREASTYESAEKLLQAFSFGGLVVALANNGDGTALIESLRVGGTRCPADCGVAVIVGSCDAQRAIDLQALQVRRIVLKPFKVKTLLETVAQLAA